MATPKTRQATLDRQSEQEALAGFNQRPGQNTGQSATGRPSDRSMSGQAYPGNASTQPANPANYNTGGSIYTSPQWYSQNQNQFGAQSAANDPYLFWSSYGSHNAGWQPGGDQMGFFQRTFDPEHMGAAMFPGIGQFTSNDQRLAGETSIANALSGNGPAAFVNPAALVGNVLKALSTGNIDQIAKLNPTLGAILNGNVGDPVGQASSLINFLGQALQGSMPQDVLKAFIGSLGRMADQFYSQASGRGANLDAQNFAQFLTRSLGPTLGL